MYVYLFIVFLYLHIAFDILNVYHCRLLSLSPFFLYLFLSLPLSISLSLSSSSQKQRTSIFLHCIHLYLPGTNEKYFAKCITRERYSVVISPAQLYSQHFVPCVQPSSLPSTCYLSLYSACVYNVQSWYRIHNPSIY